MIDPAAAVSVFANGVLVPATGYTLNYLYGIVTFAVAPTAPVTLNYTYIPLGEACSVKGISVTTERVVLDTSTFCTTNSDQGHRRKLMGLADLTAEIESVDPSSDATRGAFLAAFEDGEVPVVLEYQPDRGDTTSLRAFGFLSSAADMSQVEALAESSYTFTATSWYGERAWRWSDL